MKTVDLTFKDREYVELIKSLKSVEKSCYEALDGTWDRSDDGFSAMAAEIAQSIMALETARLHCGF